MVKTALLLLIELGILSLIYCIVSFLEYKIVFEDLKQFYKFKFITIFIFAIGFLVHTLGDVLGSGTRLEMQLETVGHFIIMVGTLIIIKQTLHLLKIAEEYGYD